MPLIYLLIPFDKEHLDPQIFLYVHIHILSLEKENTDPIYFTIIPFLYRKVRNQKISIKFYNKFKLN